MLRLNRSVLVRQALILACSSVTFALSAADLTNGLTIPSGFELRVFATEPEIIQPVAMTWDERGRLWILERSEPVYPGRRFGKEVSRIQILEDVDADGHADKSVTFAKDLPSADGLALGDGGLYLTAGTNLLFLEDINGDGQADREHVIVSVSGVVHGEGRLTDVAWGPDGYLYLNHRLWEERDQSSPTKFGRSACSVLRYQPRTQRTEVFADRIPFGSGLDWNGIGEVFVRAQGSNHLYHVIPAGHYTGKPGRTAHPYAYLDELPSKALPSITDWSHDEAGGISFCVYQGNQFPTQWLGMALLGTVNGIDCDRLAQTGSSYRATKAAPLVVSTGAAFTPVNLQVGPDGALWIADLAHAGKDKRGAHDFKVATSNKSNLEIGLGGRRKKEDPFQRDRSVNWVYPGKRSMN